MIKSKCTKNNWISMSYKEFFRIVGLVLIGLGIALISISFIDILISKM